jgi:hypothetical protein
MVPSSGTVTAIGSPEIVVNWLPFVNDVEYATVSEGM